MYKVVFKKLYGFYNLISDYKNVFANSSNTALIKDIRQCGVKEKWMLNY